MNQRERRAASKEQYIKELGGKCIQCDSEENLEFDHAEPSSKLFCISQGLLLSREKLLAELKKCQLLCQSCHSKKSISERRELFKDIVSHGTPSRYTNHKCRCELCTYAWKEYLRPRLRRARLKRYELP